MEYGTTIPALSPGLLFVPQVCFLILTGKGAKKTFQVFGSGASWKDAVAHCRANNSELATIESSAENSEVTSLVASFSNPKAWIGLYREPWRWSDNTPVLFTNWRSVGDDIRGLHCVAETADHVWSPTGCDAQLPFFCHTVACLKPCQYKKNSERCVTTLFFI
uniref:C-type lectin domain-containing protein n=1 Tax=Neogobius melanostomus TaxID=47308 RepID=A0A8C6S5Z2_9GOBI